MASVVEAERIQRVFEKELERGCDNQLVIGGLDRMLIQMSEDGVLAEHRALASRVRELPAGGYRGLDAESQGGVGEGDDRGAGRAGCSTDLGDSSGEWTGAPAGGAQASAADDYQRC